MSRALRTGLVGLLVGLALATGGCGTEETAGGDATPPASAAPEPTPSPGEAPDEAPADEPTEEPARDAGTTIEITFDGDDVTPSGESRKVAAGEPVTLRIVADAPGELHVHSSPEQEVSYPAGTSERTLVIEQPGLVEVEAHDLHRLVVQLEVR